MKNPKDPFRMPADMNDIDELKAYICKLEEELALTEKRDTPPWWALNVRGAGDPPFAMALIAAVGSVTVGAIGAWHVWAFVNSFHITSPYVLFWAYLLNIVVFVGLWIGYCLFSWRCTDVKPPSLPDGVYLRKIRAHYFVGSCSTGMDFGYTKTLKGALLLAHTSRNKKG